MKHEVITHEIKGIQCDSPKCDYEDDNVEFKPEKWLNKPCPKCGSNLFTQKAWEQLKATQKFLELINGIAKKVGLDTEGAEYEKFEMIHDENGLFKGMIKKD
jgi:NMD protein affecting ribosome stability and mRNA decay